MGLIYGQGINSAGKYAATKRVNGKKKNTREYEIWRGMIRRCYDKNLPANKNATYDGCSCSENFKDFQWFAEWFNRQVGNDIEDVNLDKDILVKGNKVYSEDTCVLVPYNVNMLLTKSFSKRGKHPIGVYWSTSKKVFVSQCKDNKSAAQVFLGHFDTVEDAFAAYKQKKESVIKEVAEKYKSVIDERAYLALMAYEVDIND